MSDYDCVIVGAGFVGASLAIALNRCGFKVVVIDSRNPLVEVGHEDVRGLALSASSQTVFKDLGLWESLRERAMPIRDIQISERGTLPSVRLSAAEFGLEALAHVVPADYLLRTIENQLLDEAKVLWRSSVDSYQIVDDRIHISLSGASTGPKKLSASILIGADGINSKVRDLANIASNIRAYHQQAIVATLEVTGLQGDLAVERFTETGPVALLPSSENRHVLIRCCRLEETEQLMALSDEDFIADSTERLGRPVGQFSSLGPRRAHPLVLSQAEHLTADRVALLGAAAVTVHPNAAQGLNLGMRDVADLCHSHISVPRSELGGAAQLQAFASKRAVDHKRVIRLTDGLARGFSSHFPGAALARSIGLLSSKLSRNIRREIIYQGLGQGQVDRLPFVEQAFIAS